MIITEIFNKSPQISGFLQYLITDGTFYELAFLSVLTLILVTSALINLLVVLVKKIKSAGSLKKFITSDNSNNLENQDLNNKANSKWWLLVIALAVALGGYLRIYWCMHCPQVYFDEINIYELAKNLALDKTYLVPGRFDSQSTVFPIPPAWSFVLSLFFKIKGAKFVVVEAVSLAICLSTLPLAAIFGFQLTKRLDFAAFLTLILSFLPVHLKLSGSGALEIGSFFLLLAFLSGLLAYRDTENNLWLAISWVFFAWAVNWRMENPLIFLAAFVTLALYDGFFWRLLKNVSFWTYGIISVLLALPGIANNLYGLGKGYYLFYDTPERTAEFIRLNSVNNWRYWFNSQVHPVYLTFLAFLGLLCSGKGKFSFAWLFWFVGINIFYSRIPSADFSCVHALDSWRNALNPELGLIVLAAMGLTCLMNLCRKVTVVMTRPRVCNLIFAIILSLSVTCIFWGHKNFILKQNSHMQAFNIARCLLPGITGEPFIVTDGSNCNAGSQQAFLTTLEYAGEKKCVAALISNPAEVNPFSSVCPQLIVDLYRWNEQKLPVYLFYAGSAAKESDFNRLFWYESVLKMTAIYGEGNMNNPNYIMIYRIDDLTDKAKAWAKETGEV